MIGYVAKDKNNALYLYSTIPEYDEEYEMWTSDTEYVSITGKFPGFDNMSYKDEPIKVEISIKKV